MTTGLRAVLYHESVDFDGICRKHGLIGDAYGKFESNVTRAFRLATRQQLSQVVFAFMDDHFDTHDQQARIVHIERSVWTKHKKKGLLPDGHIKEILYTFRDALVLPPLKELGRLAATDTISYIRRVELNGDAPLRDLTREECEYLFHVFAHPEWTHAHATNDLATLRRVYSDITVVVRSSTWITQREVSTFWYLEHIRQIWWDSFVLGCFVIPWQEEEQDAPS